VKPAPRVLVVDVDRVLVDLLDEWLGALGIEVIDEGLGGSAGAAACDLAIVDVPFPRQEGARRLAGIVNAHPDTPILAVSAAFFPCVASCGALARELGVACVLPKPLAREALLSEVRRLLQR
jgi:DNA-binding response OmpR family regulator